MCRRKRICCVLSCYKSLCTTHACTSEQREPQCKPIRAARFHYRHHHHHHHRWPAWIFENRACTAVPNVAPTISVPCLSIERAIKVQISVVVASSTCKARGD